MKEKLEKYKKIKLIEFIVIVLSEVIFVGILISSKAMRTSIFVDKSLFILCTVTYFTIIISLISIFIDVVFVRRLRTESKELENIAYLDSKTGIPNRTSCNILFEKYNTPESMKGIACIVTQISNIREINKENGKVYGDRVILDFSKIFEKSGEKFGFCGRNGGNEFITVIENCDMDRIRSFVSTLSDNIDDYNAELIKGKIQIRSEYALYDYEDADSFSDLLSRAYAKLK